MTKALRTCGKSAAGKLLLGVALQLTAPLSCPGQQLPPPRFSAVRLESVGTRTTPADSVVSGSAFVPTLLAATAGSAVGLAGGLALGSALHWGGGDDPGLTGAVLGAGVGSAAGSAFFARAVHRGHGMTYGPDFTMGIGLLGSVAGIGGLALAHDLGAQDERIFLGYVLAQGATVATLMTLTWR